MSDFEKQELFLELLDPVRGKLSKFARAMTRTREEARDLAGDTILAAYEGFEKLKNRDAFGAWLISISVRLKKRGNWRKRHFAEFDDSLAETEPDTSPLPDEICDVGNLYKAMELLPEKQRQAVALFDISGFSLEEIKDIQGGTLSGVKSRLKRGRENLAGILKADNPYSDNSIDTMENEKEAQIYNYPENKSNYRMRVHHEL